MIYFFLKQKPVLLFFFFSVTFFSLSSFEKASTFMSDKNVQRVADFFIWDREVRDKYGEPVKPKDIFDGSIIYISRRKALDFFFTEFHPYIENRYIIVTYICGYRQSLKNYFPYFDDPRLIAWLGHIHDERMFNFPKFHVLPLGLNKSKTGTIANKLKEKPLEKTILLYLNFNLKNSPKTNERREAYDLLEPLPYTVFCERKNYDGYLDDIRSAKFALAPGGFSFDSYQAWEILFVGTIPVMKRHGQSKLFDGLPVLIVDDYSELTQEFLEQKYKEMSTKQYSRDKLYTDYWWNYIHDLLKKEGIKRPNF